jgi:hypothetical protein
MIKATGNSGREKSPSPKSVMVFKGIKGLVASGPGTKKTPDTKKLRPEQNEGAMIKHPPMKTMPTMTPAKTAMKTVKSGAVRVKSNIRPEGSIKRDSASTIKS